MLSRRFLLLTTVLGLFAVLLTPLAASAFTPKPPPLATPWTNQVSVTDPLPEYPRPQLTRTEWQSLNGIWQFAPASDLNNPPTGTLAEEVLVPYPIESALSGIHAPREPHVLQAHVHRPGRLVRPPRAAQLRRGDVAVEGLGERHAARHARGRVRRVLVRHHLRRCGPGATRSSSASGHRSTPRTSRSASSASTAAASGTHRRPASGRPSGSSRRNPTRITRLDTIPNVAAGGLDLTVQASAVRPTGAPPRCSPAAQVVGDSERRQRDAVPRPVPNARLWSPDDPFLYDLRVTHGQRRGRRLLRDALASARRCSAASCGRR